MTLSFECLRNNCTDDLYGKAMELYSTYKPAEVKLVSLMIILQLMRTNTEAQCMHLQVTLRKLTLTDLPGEDVPKMATLLRGIHDRLEQAKVLRFVRNESPICSYRSYATVVDYLPDSSVTKFNDQFRMLKIHRTATMEQDELEDYPTDPEKIIQLAENLYHEYMRTNEMDGDYYSRTIFICTTEDCSVLELRWFWPYGSRLY